MLVPSHFIAIVNGASTQTYSSAFYLINPRKTLKQLVFLSQDSVRLSPPPRTLCRFGLHVGFSALQFYPTLLYENVKVPLDDGNRSSAHFRVHTFRTDQIP